MTRPYEPVNDATVRPGHLSVSALSGALRDIEDARLEGEARVLLACGYEPSELTILHVQRPGTVFTNAPEVVPRSALQEQPDG